jgi:dCTP deaminase
MILSSQEIEKRLGEQSGNGSLVIRPFAAECLQPASYDLRIAEDLVLPCGICTLAHTRELVGLPADLAATLRTRSSFGRRGVLLTAGYVDPGFRGQLTLGLVNMGPEPIEIHAGDRVVQMIIHQVAGSGRTYDGKYQDSTGAIGAR